MTRTTFPRTRVCFFSLTTLLSLIAAGAAQERAGTVPPPGPQFSSPAPQPTLLDETWSIAIQPQQPEGVESAEYERIYRSIPFRRSEYLANPGYRHDAALELMFGEMRPTVIQRTDAPQRVVNPKPVPVQPYPFSLPELWHLLHFNRPWGF